MNEELRYYGFCNYYLSPLQCGLQNIHVVSEMSQYPTDDYTLWTHNYKTVILLNGGNQKSLEDLLAFFECNEEIFKCLDGLDNQFKFESFREDTDSLNGCLTAVGIILPKRVYDYNPETDVLEGFELELAIKLKTYRLI